MFLYSRFPPKCLLPLPCYEEFSFFEFGTCLRHKNIVVSGFVSLPSPINRCLSDAQRESLSLCESVLCFSASTFPTFASYVGRKKKKKISSQKSHLSTWPSKAIDNYEIKWVIALAPNWGMVIAHWGSNELCLWIILPIKPLSSQGQHRINKWPNGFVPDHTKLQCFLVQKAHFLSISQLKVLVLRILLVLMNCSKYVQYMQNE